MTRAWLDGLVFSSLWLAAGAGALVAAASHAMGIATSPAALGLAVSGTLVIYNVDRLRDTSRDRLTSPARTAFVSAHRGQLTTLCGLAAVASLYFGASAGVRASMVLLPALALGLLHRRLKGFEWAKTLYITSAWACVVVGLPAVLDPGVADVLWVTAILAASIAANAIASNVRDREAGAARVGQQRALSVARGVAGLGVALGALAPSPASTLLPVPLLTLAALVGFRPTERFGLVAVDGALLLGAAVSIVWSG